ncbi:MAG: aldehyde dehydrogenase family protein [Rhodovibrionaceae bacterium]
MAKSSDYLMLIDGEMTPAKESEWLSSLNPADEEEIGRVPQAGAADVSRAVEAAQRAQPGWNALSVTERGQLLREVGRRLLEKQDEILRLEVRDTGNTIGKMRGDLGAATAQLDYYAGLGLEIKGETIPASNRALHFTLREPYGVVGRIVPFNHPIFFAISALAGPLTAGNSVVIKPPDQSPLSASYLGEVCREVLPAGVVNIVTGSGPVTGDALVRHPEVRRLAFTGSVPTGLAIQKAAAETCVKHVTLELGGKNPMVVFPDVAPAKAAEVAVSGMNFAWQGQSCGSTSRLLLHDSIYDEVVDRIVARVNGLKIGDPLDPESQMGPINSIRHYERVVSYVEAGKQDGAKLVAGGARPQGAQFEKGYWLQPTVFAEVTQDMRIAREEIFGPILSVIRWSQLEEAVAIANATEYGLTAAIWTQDIQAALELTRKLECGYVWINGASSHHRGTPFGGKKNSGVGREECLEELLSYTQTKAVHLTMS